MCLNGKKPHAFSSCVSYFFNESIFHFTQGHCVLPTVSISTSHSGENLPDNFIGFDSAPDRVGDGSALRVRYLCSRPCWLAVEVAVSTLRKRDLVVFRRKWMDGGAVRGYKIRRVVLRWPPSILYQRDFFNRRVLDVTNVTVRAWLDLPADGREPGTYHGAMLRISKELSLPERLAKPTNVCPSWSAQIMWQIGRYRTHHCPREQGQTPRFHFQHVFTIASLLFQTSRAAVFFIFCHFFPSHRQYRFVELPTGEHW